MAAIRFLLVGLLVASGLVFRANAQPAFANGIAVIVNNEVITYRDVESSVTPVVELLVSQYEKQPDVLKQKLREVQKERLDELVARHLIMNDFTNAGYNLPESIIDDQVQARIRDEYHDRVTLTQTLRAQGITFETFKRNLRENLIISALRDKHISQELIISPQKIAAYYATNQSKYQMDDQVKLRTILLNKPKENPDSIHKLAEEILAKLKEGAVFADMAAVYSQGSQRAAGGEAGWEDVAKLNELLVEPVRKLKAGEVSGIIESSEVVYIVMVEEKRAAHVRPLTEVQPEIEKTLIAQEQARLQKKWIDRLKKKSFVRYY